MADIEESNTSLRSTTWRWKRVKIGQPPQAESRESAKPTPISPLLPWPRGRRLHVTIKYRGGPECWYEIEARGRVWRRPGAVALHDVARVILGHPQ